MELVLNLLFDLGGRLRQSQPNHDHRRSRRWANCAVLGCAHERRSIRLRHQHRERKRLWIQVGFNGTLQLLNADGQTGNTGTGSTPLDAAISNDSRFLYVLTPGTGNIQGFSVSLDGSLTPLSQATGVPSSASGLIAR